MERLLRTPLAWLFVALFLLSAGHGIVLHADHDHEEGPQHCALCVLGWTAAIAAAATIAAIQQPSSRLRSRQGDRLRESAFAYSRSQRAPPR